MPDLIPNTKARFRYPDEFREPAPQREYTNQVVTVLRTFDDSKTAQEMREHYGECLLYVQAQDGNVFTAFETELEPLPEGGTYA
jgi:hypothetical protein